MFEIEYIFLQIGKATLFVLSTKRFYNTSSAVIFFVLLQDI